MKRALRFAAVGLLAGGLGATVFFGAVVVPEAHDVLHSHREIGFVTRRVTGTLNVLGVLAIAALTADLAATWKARRGRAWAVGTLALLAVAQTALVAMRARLDGHLDPATMQIADRAAFMWLHERYLNVTSVLCLAGAAQLWTLLLPPVTIAGQSAPVSAVVEE